VYTATVYVKQLLPPAAIRDGMELQFHLIPDSISFLTYTVAVRGIRSFELMMIDGKTVRNMQSVLQE